MFARRVLAISAFVGFVLVAAVLLLSDRAGGMLGDVVSVITRAGRRVEADAGIDLLDRSDIPGQADQIVHAFFWGSGMLMIGWITRRRVPIVLTSLAVAGMSLAFELAQPLLSQTRAVEATDAVANLLGVAVATMVLLVVVSLVRRVLGDDRLYYGDQIHHRDDTTDELFLPLN